MVFPQIQWLGEVANVFQQDTTVKGFLHAVDGRNLDTSR